VLFFRLLFMDDIQVKLTQRVLENAFGLSTLIASAGLSVLPKRGEPYYSLQCLRSCSSAMDLFKMAVSPIVLMVETGRQTVTLPRKGTLNPK